MILKNNKLHYNEIQAIKMTLQELRYDKGGIIHDKEGIIYSEHSVFFLYFYRANVYIVT